MTDRELLELAAKAAGIKYDAKASQPHPVSGAFFGLWLMLHGEPYEGQRRWWNPLTDDGDALRLAVKLNINVFIYDDESSTATAGVVAKGWSSKEENTRRAIVRAAAAEIGKDMP